MRLDDFAIRKAALAVAIAGLVATIAVSEFAAPIDAEPWEIDTGMLGKSVRVSGVVKWARVSKGVLIFQLGEGSGVQCVVMRPGEMELAVVVKGARIEVEGEVEEYEGRVEIVVGRVRIAN